MRPVIFVYFFLILPIALALPLTKERPSVGTQETTPAIESRHAEVSSQFQQPQTQRTQETTSARINVNPSATIQISKSSSSTAELGQQTGPAVQKAPGEGSSSTTSSPGVGSPLPQSGGLGQVVDGVGNTVGAVSHDAGIPLLNDLQNDRGGGNGRFDQCENGCEGGIPFGF